LAEKKQYSEPLCCEFCSAPVSFVNAFTRTIGEDVVAVDPFFRLYKGHTHGDDCRYNVAGQIAIIARESDGSVLAAIEGNRYELRLLAIKKALDELRAASQQKKEPSSDLLTTTSEKEYQPRDVKLGAYINSAKRVLKVRAVCEEHSEIESILTLTFDGVRVPWSDFYFEDSDYFRCHKQLSKTTVPIPIAVHGIVKNNKIVKNKKGDSFAVLELFRPGRNGSKKGVLEVVCAAIWSPDVNAFDEYQEGKSIIAFGMWQTKPTTEVENKKTGSSIKMFVNYTMSLWPVTRSQLCHA
jgi:hypothetical protein